MTRIFHLGQVNQKSQSKLCLQRYQSVSEEMASCVSRQVTCDMLRRGRINCMRWQPCMSRPCSVAVRDNGRCFCRLRAAVFMR